MVAVPLRELEDLLSTVNLDQPSVMLAFARLLRHATSAELSVAYCPIATTNGFELDFLHADGFREESSRMFASGLSQAKSGWGLFDPVHPERSQRNVVRTIRPMTRPSDFFAAARRALGLRGASLRRYVDARLQGETTMYARLGVPDLFTSRVLVCDERALLGYVGVMHNGARRVGKILSRLVPLIRRRLVFERWFEMSSFFDAVLDALPRPTYVVSRGRRIEYANAAGVAALDRDRRGIHEAIGCALGGDSNFEAIGIGSGKFVIATHQDLTARVDALASRWQLTPRQREVLRLLASGKANKTIAATLACTVRTVEFHVTAILAKADVESRSELIAAVAST